MKFKDFCNSLVSTNPRHVNRTTDAFDWVFPQKNNLEVFHERAYFPWSRFKKSTFSYWTNKLFNNINEAEKEAEKYGGKAVQSFYCDENNPTYFLSFNDFEKAARFVYNDLEIEKL